MLADPGPMVIEQPRPSGLDDVLEAARQLPVCDRAAKIHALIARLQHALKTGATTAAVADALSAAAVDALADDPWVHLEAVVRRLKAGHPLAPPGLTPDLVHEREGHALQPVRTQLD